MSGILAILREALSIFYPKRVPQRSLFFNCVIIAFVLSAGILWTIEHKEVVNLRSTIAKEQKNKEIIRRLSVLLDQGTIIQAQCMGNHLDALKPGETTYDRYVKWCDAVNDFFRKEKELDFETYHAHFEDTSKYDISKGFGTSENNARVWLYVELRKRNLNEMINEFKIKR